MKAQVAIVFDAHFTTPEEAEEALKKIIDHLEHSEFWNSDEPHFALHVKRIYPDTKYGDWDADDMDVISNPPHCCAEPDDE